MFHHQPDHHGYTHDIPIVLPWSTILVVKTPIFSHAELPERGPIAPPAHDGAMPNTPLQSTAKGHGAGLGDHRWKKVDFNQQKW